MLLGNHYVSWVYQFCESKLHNDWSATIYIHNVNLAEVKLIK